MWKKGRKHLASFFVGGLIFHFILREYFHINAVIRTKEVLSSVIQQFVKNLHPCGIHLVQVCCNVFEFR